MHVNAIMTVRKWNKIDILLPGDAQQIVVDSATAATAAIKKLTPVKTGRLVGSIAERVKELQVDIYTNVEYAKYVEYGTKTQEEQSYMRAGLDEARANIRAILKATVHDRIRNG